MAPDTIITLEQGESIYFIRVENQMTWEKIAELLNTRNWNRVYYVAKQFAISTGKQWPVDIFNKWQPKKDTINKWQKCYELRLTGLSWVNVSKTMKCKNDYSSYQMAKSYSQFTGKPWPIEIPRQPKISPERKSRRIELYQSGKTIREIADLDEVSPASIWNTLFRAGVLKRSQNRNTRPRERKSNVRKR